MGAQRPGEEMTSPTTSETRPATAVEDDVPRMEPWLSVTFSAFAPLALAFVLPRVLQPYLFTAGALLVLGGIVMLVRQERRKATDIPG
jgi:hypothetical protein